ncbi:MAG: hypothetical protein Q9199_005391 [Rusavskia elegans]
MDRERAGIAQLPRNSNTELLRKLSAIVNGHGKTATFACGGSVDPTDTSKDGRTPGVTIRWDARDDRDPHKTSFPCSQGTTQGFEALVQRCEPATFGLENRNVLDEGYRKAGKLDNTAFSTNFHPHDFGIVDAVQQILMPYTMGGAQGNSNQPHGVRAELYKLNVYSAPSGKFLSHVDTPRGLNQFGSLIVCLPCAHEGGTLRVKHFGQTIDFTWAGPDPESIHWAAFYGDCEHEVLEVTSGHRVTLTYNLYYTALGNLALPMSDPTKLPLYDTVAQMLREPNFMRKGGCLGFFCHHAYAHSTEAGRELIPGAFKGVDLAVFSAFSGLGLEVDTHPILHKWASWPYGDKIKNKWGGLPAKELLRGSVSDGNNIGDFVDAYLNAVDRKQQDMMVDRDESDSDFDEDEEGQKEFLREEMTIVGSELHGPKFNANQDEDLDNKASRDNLSIIM